MVFGRVETVGVVAAVAAAWYLLTSKRRRAPHPLSRCAAAPGRAAVYSLLNCDRTDAPGGRTRSPPGRPAAHYLDVSAEAVGDVSVAELFAERTAPAGVCESSTRVSRGSHQ